MDSKQDSDFFDIILSEQKPKFCYCCFQVSGNPVFNFFLKNFFKVILELLCTLVSPADESEPLF